MTLREALLAMGYHEAEPQKWLKPIGYQVFSFNEKLGRWGCWFLGQDGKILCWNTEDIKPEDFAGDFLHQLKHFECYTRTDVGGGNPNSHFELGGLATLDL